MTALKRPAPISADLYKRLKVWCAANDELVRDALEEAVRGYLEEVDESDT